MNKRVVLSVAAGALIALYLKFCAPDIGYVIQGPGWSDGMDSFEPYWMAVWLMMLAPAWCLGLWEYEDELKRTYMTAYRYRFLSKWWLRINLRVVVKTVLSYGVAGLLLRLLMGPEWELNTGLSVLLILVHGLALMTYALWIRLLSGNMIASAIAVMVMECLGKVMVTARILTPGRSLFSWGMLSYSTRVYGSRGFSLTVGIVVQLLIFVSLTLFVTTGKLKEILLGRISNGKND